VSVWLSVDPLAGKSPNQTPYHFVSNNPVMRIDPNGLTDFENSTTGDIISVNDGMNQTVSIDSKNWQTAVNYSQNLNVVILPRSIIRLFLQTAGWLCQQHRMED